MTLTDVRMRETAHRITLAHLEAHPTMESLLPGLRTVTGQQIEALLKSLENHHAQVQGVMANDRLSAKAKQEDAAKQEALTRKNLASVLDQAGMEANVKRLEAEMINTIARTRKQYTAGKDQMEILLDRLDQQEARREARRVREEARQVHQAKMEAAQRDGVPLSDDEHQFKDPIAALWLEACKGYSTDRENFIAALERSPLGVPFLDPETIDRGLEAIKQTVCAHLTPSLAAAQVRLAQAQELARIAEEALQTFPAQQEERPFMSDQQRQPATA